MPAPIYIPRRQNPWTNMMPGLLQSLVVQKIGQNMRLKEKEMEIKQRDIEAKAEKEERADLIKFRAQKEGRSVHKYNDARGERHFPAGSVINPLRPTEAFGAKPDVSSEYVETNVPNVYIHPQTGKTIVKPPPAQAKDDRTPLQKTYDRYIKNNPKYTKDIVQFRNELYGEDKKGASEKDPSKVANQWVKDAQSGIIDKHFSLQRGSFEGLSSSAVAQSSFAKAWFANKVSGMDPAKMTKAETNKLAHDAVIQSGLVAKKLRGKPPGAYKIDKTITVFWDGEALSTEFPEPAPEEESSGSIWPWSD
jgi:hypothetical protein